MAEAVSHDVRLHAAGEGRYRVEGTLDLSSVSILLGSEAGMFGPGRETIIDLSGVGRADSAGVALLIEWLRRARQRGGEIRYAAVPAQMQAIIGLCDLDGLLPVTEDLPAGCRRAV